MTSLAIQKEISRDSIEKKISGTKNIQQKINLLINYSQNLRFKKPEEAIKYCKRAYTIANKNHFLTEHIAATKLLANLYKQVDNIQPAINFYLICTKLQKENGNKNDLIQTYNELGDLYVQNNYNQELALEYFMKSLKYSHELKDQKSISRTYNSLGRLYFLQNDIQKASNYFHKAFQIRKDIQDSIGIGSSLNNLGEIDRINRNYNKALKNYRTSLKIHQRLNTQEKIAVNYKNIGLLYYGQGKLNKAQDFFNKGLSIAEKMQKKSMIADLSYNIGLCYLDNNKLTIALAYFDHALLNVIATRNFQTQLEILAAKSKIYEIKKDYKNALLLQKKLLHMNDSLKNHEKEDQIAELQARFHFAQQQKELVLMDKENALLKRNQSIARLKQTTLISILGIIITLAFILANKMRKRSIKNQKLLYKKQAIHLAQKKNFETQLHQKQKDLTELALHIVQKNDFLSQIQKDLKNLKKCKEADREDRVNEITSNLAVHLQINKELQTLESNINQHHQDFFQILKEKFPRLSCREQQLCAFLRLNLSTKEIASLKNASIKSVEMGRYRLRQKLHLSTNESITTFLRQL